MRSYRSSKTRKDDDSSLPALEKVASNASQQYKRSRPSASKKAAQGAKLLRTSEPHPLFNTGSSDALRRAISGYRPPQSILELKSKDESLGAAAKDFRAKIDRKKALEEKRHLQAADCRRRRLRRRWHARRRRREPRRPRPRRVAAAARRAEAPPLQFEMHRRLKTGQAPRAARTVWKSNCRGASPPLLNRRRSTRRHLDGVAVWAPTSIQSGSAVAEKGEDYGAHPTPARISAQVQKKADDLQGFHIYQLRRRQTGRNGPPTKRSRRDDSAAGAGLQMLEEALLDVAPDEALDMLKRQVHAQVGR